MYLKMALTFCFMLLLVSNVCVDGKPTLGKFKEALRPKASTSSNRHRGVGDEMRGFGGSANIPPPFAVMEDPRNQAPSSNNMFSAELFSLLRTYGILDANTLSTAALMNAITSLINEHDMPPQRAEPVARSWMETEAEIDDWMDMQQDDEILFEPDTTNNPNSQRNVGRFNNFWTNRNDDGGDDDFMSVQINDNNRGNNRDSTSRNKGNKSRGRTIGALASSLKEPESEIDEMVDIEQDDGIWFEPDTRNNPNPQRNVGSLNNFWSNGNDDDDVDGGGATVGANDDDDDFMAVQVYNNNNRDSNRGSSSRNRGNSVSSRKKTMGSLASKLGAMRRGRG